MARTNKTKKSKTKKSVAKTSKAKTSKAKTTKAKTARKTSATRAERAATRASAAPLPVYDRESGLRKMLAVLRDTAQPLPERYMALQSLQASSFSAPDAFAAIRPDYIKVLRDAAADRDKELRQRVLGILMREHDGFAQETLLAGLRDPKKALLPPEKALQLLSYDVHAGAYAIARRIIDKPPNDRAKREALRLLAADSRAAPVFEKVLRDKKELRENRQIAASALHALAPESLARHARAILLDKSDYDDIKATSLTALANFGHEKVARDKALLAHVGRLRTRASAKVKRGARAFLSRFGQSD